MSSTLFKNISYITYIAYIGSNKYSLKNHINHIGYIFKMAESHRCKCLLKTEYTVLKVSNV